MTLSTDQARLNELLVGSSSSLTARETKLLAITKSNEPDSVKDLAKHLLKHTQIFLAEESFQKAVRARAAEIAVPVHKIPTEEIERVRDNL